VGRGPNRDAIGATVLVRAGGHVQRHTVTAGVGFCSQNDLRIHVGLGDATLVDEVEIRWPSGARQVVPSLPADRQHRIEEPAS